VPSQGLLGGAAVAWDVWTLGPREPNPTLPRAAVSAQQASWRDSRTANLVDASARPARVCRRRQVMEEAGVVKLISVDDVSTPR
jgi:hypothetical protein